MTENINSDPKEMITSHNKPLTPNQVDLLERIKNSQISTKLREHVNEILLNGTILSEPDAPKQT